MRNIFIVLDYLNEFINFRWALITLFNKLYGFLWFLNKLFLSLILSLIYFLYRYFYNEIKISYLIKIYGNFIYLPLDFFIDWLVMSVKWFRVFDLIFYIYLFLLYFKTIKHILLYRYQFWIHITIYRSLSYEYLKICLIFFE